MYEALVGNQLSPLALAPTTNNNYLRSQLSSRGTSYRLSKQERLREREVNLENSILLSKMLDIIKRKRGSAQSYRPH
jgi:hypothetical protein